MGTGEKQNRSASYICFTLSGVVTNGMVKADVAQKIGCISESPENIVGKGDNAGFQHCLLFLLCFSDNLLQVNMVLFDKDINIVQFYVFIIVSARNRVNSGAKMIVFKSKLRTFNLNCTSQLIIIIFLKIVPLCNELYIILITWPFY